MALVSEQVETWRQGEQCPGLCPSSKTAGVGAPVHGVPVAAGEVPVLGGHGTSLLAGLVVMAVGEGLVVMAVVEGLVVMAVVTWWQAEKDVVAAAEMLHVVHWTLAAVNPLHLQMDPCYFGIPLHRRNQIPQALKILRHPHCCFPKVLR